MLYHTLYFMLSFSTLALFLYMGNFKEQAQGMVFGFGFFSLCHCGEIQDLAFMTGEYKTLRY